MPVPLDSVAEVLQHQQAELELDQTSWGNDDTVFNANQSRFKESLAVPRLKLEALPSVRERPSTSRGVFRIHT